MFERFGEMSSAKEINELAENLFNEGDRESLEVLAEENGIPADFVELFCSGEIPALCDPMTAALGKIEVEAEELKPQELMADWVEYMKAQCMDNEMIAFQVRKKGKSLKGCIGAILQWSFKHQTEIDKELLKKAGIPAGRVPHGEPGMETAKKIIREYYLGK